MPSVSPSKLAAYPIRSFLTGICFSTVTAGSAWVIITLLPLIFPTAFNSVLFLVVSLPLVVITLSASLGLGMMAALRVAKHLNLPHPVMSIVVSAIIGFECIILLHSLWPFMSLMAFWACSIALATGAFMLVDTLSLVRLPRLARVIGYMLPAFVLAIAIVAANGQGARQARREALTKLDYVIYLPSSDSGFSQPDYISPSHSSSTNPLDFKKGAALEFRGNVNVQVYESKYVGEFNEDCSPYIQALENRKQTCKLVGQTDTIKIYLETQSDTNGSVMVERYYGLTPTTFINVGMLTDPATQSQDKLRTWEFLKTFRAVATTELLATLREVNPKDFW